ncbi:hypothetical protein HJC23_003526 [Cyclotella cryptica]|uniref:DUF924 domain-containing protein n=1 Tax=Cyclotella cryptica TaxID=29204 RepID=A0ABD3NYX8_9STRA|eukprot:CCRYP_018886-RA/>CCRYP_018886-RA protein AED:0.02 eAED:-0.02 QI:0/-1/0/1/-1/1/1/0/186
MSSTNALPSPTEVLNFWFDELTPPQWFAKSTQIDDTIASRFTTLHTAASSGELAPWRSTAQGTLAEIIVLDQFSRNIYRDTPKAFTQDPLAVTLAEEAISKGLDAELTTPQKMFLYMPFMHSENLAHHERATELFAQDGLENAANFEKKHRVIIDRFGRYPHRNEILGRESTPEEIAFLKEPDSSF